MKFGKLLGASLLGAVSIFTTLSATAADATAGPGYNDPWGMSGCGFASLFVKDKAPAPQVGGSVLNFIISGPTNSFAISSGTSNCVAEGKSVAVNPREIFITVNLASLSKEAAQGNGEHISALAEQFGCPHDAFAKMSQTHYKNIYGTNEPTSVLQNYLKEVNADSGLAKSCLKVI